VPCYRCDKVQVDPQPGRTETKPWARGVMEGHQILICPECQDEDPTWTSRLDTCPACKSTRVSIVMGSLVCRACGRDSPL
jgi:hypothetical protein